MGAHLINGLIHLWVDIVVRVDTEDFADIDVFAVFVNLGIVGDQCRVGDTVRLLDPLAGAVACQQA